MLPEGVTADLVPPAHHREWVARFRPARTVVTLRQGGCACALTGHRHPDQREEERRLRARYRSEGVDRGRVIQALDRHRRAPGHDARGAARLAGFAAEHARNAGPSLFYLDFSAESERVPAWPPVAPAEIAAANVRAHPDTWLPEQTPVLVTA